MDVGTLATGFLTGLREGVEAALIIAIILAYLAKTGNARYFGRIWIGVGAAIVLSVVAGVAIFVTLGELPAGTEQVFEGLTMLLAAGVVTWMLFWMRRQAASVSSELRAAVDKALTEGSLWALTILAFIAVIREGVETALFLVAQASAAGTDTGAVSLLIGASLGLATAAVLGYGFYRGSRRLNLSTFFRWTGIALVFIAAGLVSHGVHEFIEAGVITIGTETAFDVSAILPHDGPIGSILRALFGYTSTPEWATFIAWLAYIAIVLPLYLRPVKPAQAQARASESSPAASA